jgi:hypothetical protein
MATGLDMVFSRMVWEFDACVLTANVVGAIPPLSICSVILKNRKKIRTDFEQIFAATNLAAFSQGIRRAQEVYAEEPILLKRLQILKDERFLFTNHFKFEQTSAFSAPLDRSMRFLDEKLQSSGQFRSSDSIYPMLNAWAIVNNLRSFLPGAKKAGQSLAEFFGADLQGIPLMESLNLCSVAALAKLLPSPFS